MPAGTPRTTPSAPCIPEDESLLVTTSGDPLLASHGDPAGRARALQYDIALNGWELGGGSVRFHTREMLSRSFSLQGHSLEAQEAKFSGILEAFEYGAPPHGGIALGVDRWIALLTDQTNIREVMAFPKTLLGLGPHARRALAGGAGAARGAGPGPEAATRRRSVAEPVPSGAQQGPWGPGQAPDGRGGTSGSGVSAAAAPHSGGGPPTGSGGPA